MRKGIIVCVCILVSTLSVTGILMLSPIQIPMLPHLDSKIFEKQQRGLEIIIKENEDTSIDNSDANEEKVTDEVNGIVDRTSESLEVEAVKSSTVSTLDVTTKIIPPETIVNEVVPEDSDWSRVRKGDVIGYQGDRYDRIYLAFILRDTGIHAIDPFANGFLVKENNLVKAGKYHEPLFEGRIYDNPISFQYRIYNEAGPGAEVYAVTDGLLSKPRTDGAGSKYVILKHDDGYQSVYCPLK